MNVERMKILAETLRKPKSRLPINFNMNRFMYCWNFDSKKGQSRTKAQPRPGSPKSAAVAKECGTTCCIGGLAVLLFGRTGDEFNYDRAKELLGLDDQQAGKLFYNRDHYVSGERDLSKIRQSDAASAVERMVAQYEAEIE